MKQLILFLGVISTSLSVQFKIINYHGGPINVGIQGNSGKPHLEGGGFTLDQGASRVINVSFNDWGGKIWARTWCVHGTHCETGDCNNKLQCGGTAGASPVTVIEITLRGYNRQDFYDISLVDGFNSKALIRPIDGRGQCPTLQCNDLNLNCPNDLRLYYDGHIIGCKSACVVKNEPQYCCTGEYGPGRCNPNTWPDHINSGKYFKANCPQAFSHVYDENNSTLNTCVADIYEIEFS